MSTNTVCMSIPATTAADAIRKVAFWSRMVVRDQEALLVQERLYGADSPWAEMMRQSVSDSQWELGRAIDVRRGL